MEIRPLTPDDHPAAAGIVADGVTRLRGTAPALPARWTEPAEIVAALGGHAARAPSWGAVHEGGLVGHLGGSVVDWGFGPLSWSPEWGWAVARLEGAPATRRTAIHDLYTVAAERWTAAGARAHWLSVLADDRGAVEAFTWLGFGHQVVNAIRDLAPIEPGHGLAVRAATAADVGILQELEDRLREHLTQSPTLLPPTPARSPEDQRRRIEDPAGAVLLAITDGREVGYMLVGPVADDVAAIVQDPGTASISGAFVRPEWRRSGVAETLLAAAIEWARRNGYERLGVDFESANMLASRFWLRHFAPVTYAMVRRLAS
jgi:GNAT superfamily N-acetyltransferase